MSLTLATVAQANAPAPTAVEAATKAALESVAKTGSAAPRDATTGRFVEASATETAPEAGQAVESTTAEVPGSEAGSETIEAPAGDGEAEAGEAGAVADATGGEVAEEEAGEGEAEAAEANEALVVKLPGRNGEEVEIEVDTPEIAERLRQLRNGYQAGEQARAAQARAAEQMIQVEDERITAAANPLAFLRDVGLAERPGMVEHVVLSLLAENWDTLRDRVLALDDPGELRTVKAEERARQLELNGQVREQIATQRAVDSNLAEINSTVAGYVPATMTEAQAEIFKNACLGELKRVADHEQLVTLPAARIPTILARHLAAYGIDPAAPAPKPKPAAKPALAGRPAAVAKPAVPAVPAVPAPKAPAAPAKPAPNGARFVASARAKARAAAPPPGAGSPGAGAVTPPRTKDGQPLGLEATLAWHRANKGRVAVKQA